MNQEILSYFLQSSQNIPILTEIRIPSELLKDLIGYLGDTFIRDHIIPNFNQYLPPPPLENQEEFSDQELKTYHSCILPVYAQGLLAKIEAPADLADKLQELAISYCTTAGQ